jgi:hypothetical protein
LMNWKQVKDQKLQVHFQRAAEVYNRLQQENMQMEESSIKKKNGTNNNDNDNTPGNNNNNTANSIMGGLPTLFRVQSNGSETNNIDNKGDDIQDVQDIRKKDRNEDMSDTFYIAAPLAQSKNDDEFAMLIHSSYANPDLCPQLVAKDNSNDDDDDDENSKLDFKPSLTKCTILERTYLHVDDNNDGGSKPKKYPVTMVLLEPKTGRRHQLRVHTALMGHAIMGDNTYQRRRRPELTTPAPGEEGEDDDDDDDPVQRLCLHSYSLEIPLGEAEASDDASSSGCFKVTSEKPFTLDLDDNKKLKISMF